MKVGYISCHSLGVYHEQMKSQILLYTNYTQIITNFINYKTTLSPPIDKMCTIVYPVLMVRRYTKQYSMKLTDTHTYIKPVCKADSRIFLGVNRPEESGPPAKGQEGSGTRGGWNECAVQREPGSTILTTEDRQDTAPLLVTRYKAIANNSRGNGIHIIVVTTQ